MKRLSFVGLLVIWLLLGSGQSQERYNYLAINGTMSDDAVGPYYFIAQGNSKDAFARTDLLAHALGVSVLYDPATHELRFRRGERQVRLKTTSDIAEGLSLRSAMLNVDGEMRDSPMGILIEGSSYVPVDPIVTALGGASEFDASSLVLFIDIAPAQQAPVQDVLTTLDMPRYAFHEDLSRVALNIPENLAYQLLVTENQLAVKLPGVSVPSFNEALSDPYLEAIRFATIHNEPALVINTHHALDASGKGYRVGVLGATEARPDGVLYIDFAPGLEGQSAQRLEAAPVTEPPTANAPSVKKTVVIDAGHGGHDPGTLSSYATEEHVVLAVALDIKERLEARGIEVILTRADDSFLSLGERANFAKPEVNAFISIHVNGVEDPSAQGIETFIFGKPINDSLIALAIKENGGGSEGRVLTQEALAEAQSVMGDVIRQGQLSYSRQLAENLQTRMVRATGARDRGVKTNSFAVLREARTPSVLVEMGFATHPDEGARLATKAYQQQLAQALSEGIVSFLEQDSPVASR